MSSFTVCLRDGNRHVCSLLTIVALATVAVVAAAQDAEQPSVASDPEVLGDPYADPGLQEDTLQYPLIVPEPPAPNAMPPLPTVNSWAAGQGVGDQALALALASESGGATAMLPTTIAAGRTPATFAVSNSGAATYTIPLWSPPGVGEVQLELALVYSSRGQNGVLGMGWSLSGLSAITRCNKTWAQDGAPGAVANATSDRLCLDGQQLKLVSGSYGQAGSVYATEIESGSSWKRVGRSGVLMLT